MAWIGYWRHRSAPMVWVSADPGEEFVHAFVFGTGALGEPPLAQPRVFPRHATVTYDGVRYLGQCEPGQPWTGPLPADVTTGEVEDQQPMDGGVVCYESRSLVSDYSNDGISKGHCLFASPPDRVTVAVWCERAFPVGDGAVVRLPRGARFRILGEVGPEQRWVEPVGATTETVASEPQVSAVDYVEDALCAVIDAADEAKKALFRMRDEARAARNQAAALLLLDAMRRWATRGQRWAPRMVVDDDDGLGTSARAAMLELD